MYVCMYEEKGNLNSRSHSNDINDRPACNAAEARMVESVRVSKTL